MSLLEKVRAFFLNDVNAVLGDKFLLAVSGGVDSVVMLDLCVGLREELPVDFIVAHFDHCQRPSSGEDAKFVENLAHSYGLDCVLGKLEEGLDKKVGLEAALREKRYKFLFSVADKFNVKAILLAHNKDDQAETVLMNFLRGAGLQGLRGISVAQHRGRFLIGRPLLDVWKREIEDYAESRGLSFRVDETNFSLDFFRNKIRHELLPFLEKEYNTQIKDRLVILSNIIAKDYDFIYNVSTKVFENAVILSNEKELLVSRIAVSDMHESILRQVFRLCIEKLKGDLRQIDFRHYQEFIKMLKDWPVGAVLDLPLGVSIEKKKRIIRFYLRGDLSDEKKQ